MKRKILMLTIGVAVLVMALSLSNAPTSAKPADVYAIDWYTIDGGGAMSLSGGTYTLSGTAGQPDAGMLTGGNYRLYGGFWEFLGSLVNLYLPLIKR